jgi:prophage regulatory protein
MRLLDREGLKKKGLSYSPSQLWRLAKAGRFPPPVKIGSKLAWVEDEIDALIAARIAAREIEAP